MGRFLRRKHVTEEQPEEQSFWQVPARYNFSRDVVEAYAADPLRPALTFVDRDGIIDRRTFADIAIDAGRWAGLLRSRGLEPGDRVLVVVGLNRTWHGVMLGALKAGVVAIPCPASLDIAEIHRRARDAGARVAVVEADRASEVWQSEAPLTIVVVDEVEPELREIPPIQPTHDTAADDEALILYTSGTTGTPKGTILTHASTWAARVPAEHWLDARTGDLVWCTVGQSWALSIWSILFYPWSRGAESVLHDAEFDPEQRFDLLQRLGVTVLCQSPTEYRLLTEAPWISRFDLGRLRHAVSSGERLELETITAFRKVFDVTIHDGYGQAENALLVANARGTAVKPGSMGLPLPGHDVAVVDEAGAELPADAEGDLVLRGRPPTLFAGYIEGTAETADVFRGDWYLTGDRATRDADGYLWFTGRGAPLREVAADRARAVEAREAEILALENAHVGDVSEHESARLDDAVGRKQKRAAADAKRVEAEAAARAERRADLERRTAEALAADEVRREDERRAAEAEAEAAERARLEAETAQRERERLEQERRDAEAALIEERARREAEAEAAERARLETEAAEAARLEAEAAQRERERLEQERRDAEAALAEAALIEERARRQAEAEAAERARLEAEAAEAARLEAEAAQREREQREREQREQERRDAEAARAEAALAEERTRREQEEAEARVAAAAATVETADAAPSATPALSGRAARKEQQRIRKEEERARKDEERRRKEEERARKDAERKQQEEERAAAERRKREEAEEQKAAAERAKLAEQRRKEEEKQRRDEEKAAQEVERREAEARQREARAAAETQRAEEARQKAAEEERRKEEERRRKAAEKERREAERQRKPPAPGETVAEPGDESLDEDRPNAELIARLRAYGLRQPDDGEDE